MTEQGLEALFSEYGTVRSMNLSRDIFSGQCRGFANIEMEGHEARAAIAALDGKSVDGSSIQVAQDRPRKGRGGRRR
jgi:RNA recognition motif-containing protein